MKMDKMDALREQCLQCRKCGLCETRTNVVFGVGDPEAELLFIGEGPGEQEDRQGEPFVGRAGKLLDTWLEILRLERKNVYIANMVKCRPPGNRDPMNTEQEACADWLNRQLEIIRPKLIVCLGRIAAMTWICPDFKITKEHGQWFPGAEDRKVMALFHPAALLRDPRKLPETFEDLKRLEAEIAASCPKTWAVMQRRKETEC